MNARTGRKAFALPVWSIALCLVAPACGRSETTSPAPAGEKQLVVFAATSLRDAFTAIAEDFRRSRAGVKVTLNFAGTQELRAQLQHGAAVDVFASADQHHMDELVAARRAVHPVVFARNEPVIVVARERVATLRSFTDLPQVNRLVVGTPEVPIGRYTLQILDRASLALGADFRARALAKVVSRELNVRQILAKVDVGEADAGFVYRTDALAAGPRVGIVSIPEALNVIAMYPIAVVAGAAHPKLSRAWVDHVLSDAGQRTLQRFGFLAPSGDAEAP